MLQAPEWFSKLPGPREPLRSALGWTPLFHTSSSGVFSGRLCGRATFGCTRVVSRLGCEGHLPHSNGGNSSLPLFISVWTGVADGPQTGERTWELLCDLWRAVAPLFAPWCAEGELPTCANLNHYSGSGSCVRWHRDDEVLFGAQGESKLIVSVSIGYSAFFRWKLRSSPDCDADSSWSHHDDLCMGVARMSAFTVRIPFTPVRWFIRLCKRRTRRVGVGSGSVPVVLAWVGDCVFGFPRPGGTLAPGKHGVLGETVVFTPGSMSFF